MTATDIKMAKCDWETIQPHVEEYLRTYKITVESFWEDHVLQSNHYRMTFEDKLAGYFSIHDGKTIMLFHVFPAYANLSQELFARAKAFECVTNAMVATGDEFLLSHCFDQYARIEKQAYLSIYTDKAIPAEQAADISLRLADIDSEEDMQTLALSGDFLDEVIDDIRQGIDVTHIYIAQSGAETVGFGVVQYGRILRDAASTGMYVCEEYRQRGIGSSILQQLKHIVQENGCRAFSGCWYYNHNSKKSMERAGAYSKTRLIRFFF